jgi:tetratricopeptide (TPR) repeat protein
MLEELDEGRFRLHDLQRDYARQQAELTDSENDRNAAIRRMLEWYLNRAVDADLVLRPTRRRVGPLFADEREPGFASHQAALDWLTGEQRNIVLAVHAADEHGWDDLTWQFCEALWGFFLHHRFYSDWLDIHALGIPAAKREGNVLAQAYLRTQLCFALTGLHRYDDATREGRIALDLAVQKNDKATQAMVLGELAGAVQGTGDLHGALSYLHQAKEIRDVIGTDRAVALILRRIGEILDQLGRTEEAVVALRTAADALLDLDRAQHGSTLTRLGAVYLRSGRISDAMPLLTTALSIAREFDSPHYEAAALVVLGDAAWHHNNAAKASDRWTAAHTIYSASGDPKAADVERRLAGITSARADEV